MINPTQTPNPKRVNFPKPFKRKKFKPRLNKLIAYDLETTNISAGTPEPLYITAYGHIKIDYDTEEFRVAEKLTGFENLLEVLATEFLLPEYDGCKFVGWNANNFDAYLIAKALLLDNRYMMRPYMTRSKSLRGMRVIDMSNGCEFEFLDGIAMTGCVMKLEEFLAVFAPDHPKMKNIINFDAGEQFNYRNQKHCEYAMRDSVGLYHALLECQRIIKDSFGMYLTPTIGNLGIKIFQSYMPHSAKVQPLPPEAERVLRDYVMRGGFCYCVKQYTGPVWKYDINQAYAAAMREAWMPDGAPHYVKSQWPRYPGIYHVINAKNPSNKIPFYYRDMDGDSVFGRHEISETWLTSSEIEQLQSEGWAVKVVEGYLFSGRFKMQEFVDTLEHLRITAPGGPKGAKGTVMKAIGNNSYGKTCEVLDGVEYVMCNECPEGFMSAVVQIEGDDFLPIWVKKNEPVMKDYHKPQIGAFITAEVRMKLRRAALTDPDAWLYGDTDCVVFSRPAALETDSLRYGAWKIECEGDIYRLIAKKVYAKLDNSEKHAKGMNVKKLTAADFEKWSKGEPPIQNQLHRNNIMKVLAGADMYIQRIRKGTKI
jgi:hypothetical protein